MSFVMSKTNTIIAPGWFLAAADCQRMTKTIAQDHSQVVTVGTTKHVPMGAFWPANSSSTVKGIVYEDVDVTSGDMPGSVVMSGEVYLDRLPASPESGVQSALEALGFKFYATSPAVVRPNFKASGLTDITVNSVAGTASGDTKLTTDYTLGNGESYIYKAADTTAPATHYGDIPSGWTAWDGTSDLTIASDKKVTVAVIDSTGSVVAAGSATATAQT